MNIRFALVAAAAFACLVTGVGSGRADDETNSGDNKHWYFQVQNESTGTVNEFRTQEDGEWSENWLTTRLEPGDNLKLDFETDEGSCTVRTQIHLVDGTYFDAPVDYCKANTLVIQNGTLIWK